MIYDAFMFFNELDVLEIRLHELDLVVDCFVIAEATVTHSNRPKPLHYADNASRFAAFRNKIRHVVVDDMPGGGDPWVRENHQRNAVVRGLADCRPDDLVMISDADEVPAAAAVRSYQPQDGRRCFEQLSAYYWLNCVSGLWAGTRILPFQSFRAFPHATAVRFHQCPWLRPGGWHFSYMGGPNGIRDKLEAFAHQELNRPELKDPRYLQQVTASAADLFGRDVYMLFVNLDERFPAYVLAHKDRFRHMIREARFHENWYSDQQLLQLARTFELVRSLSGAVMEIGCWEGRSTIALANACHPEPLIAVDTWLGSSDESPDHPTVTLARQRDVFADFRNNIATLTDGNVVPVRRDCHEFLRQFDQSIKFCHIDAAHDYASVKRTLGALLPRVVPGGVLCGDDFLTASAARTDLGGGVEKALRDTFGSAFVVINNFWYWRNAA